MQRPPFLAPSQPPQIVEVTRQVEVPAGPTPLTPPRRRRRPPSTMSVASPSRRETRTASDMETQSWESLPRPTLRTGKGQAPLPRPAGASYWPVTESVSADEAAEVTGQGTGSVNATQRPNGRTTQVEMPPPVPSRFVLPEPMASNLQAQNLQLQPPQPQLQQPQPQVPYSQPQVPYSQPLPPQYPGRVQDVLLSQAQIPGPQASQQSQGTGQQPGPAAIAQLERSFQLGWISGELAQATAEHVAEHGGQSSQDEQDPLQTPEATGEDQHQVRPAESTTEGYESEPHHRYLTRSRARRVPGDTTRFVMLGCEARRAHLRRYPPARRRADGGVSHGGRPDTSSSTSESESST